LGGTPALKFFPSDLERQFTTTGPSVLPRVMSVEATATKRAGDRVGYGVVCARQVSETSGYIFAIDDAGFATILRLDAAYGLVPLKSVDAPSSAIEESRANRITGVCDHAKPNRVRLRLEVNGEVVLRATDTVSPLAPGLPGIWAEWVGGATRPTITFTDFAMRGRPKSG
jgi:hypothetical protein